MRTAMLQRLFFLAIPVAILSTDRARGITRHWTGAGDWSMAGNWMPFGVPLPTDDAVIGNSTSATVDVNVSVASLLIDNESLVSVITTLLSVDEVTLQNPNGDFLSQLFVAAGGTVDADFIFVGEGGRIDVAGGRVFAEDLEINPHRGGISGFGTVEIDNIIGELVNNGLISGFFGELVIESDNTIALDLDGVNETGMVSAFEGSVRIETGLLDPYNNEILVGPGHHIAFNGGGASLGDGGQLTLWGFEDEPARVQGDLLQLASGSVLRVGGGNLGIVENHLIIASGATVQTPAAPLNYEIRLAGNTWFQGGTLVGDGRIRQDGDAFFNADTEINIYNTYDMDGQAENTTLNIDPGVTVTIISQHIETDNDNAFDGTMHVNGGSLHMEHDWTLDGTLNLTQDGSTAELTGPGRVTVSADGVINVSGAGRIDSPITLVGSLSVSSVVDVNGDTIIDSSAELETNAPNDAINLYGPTVIGGGSYLGGGLLRFQGDIDVIGDTSIDMGLSDLDGTGLGGSLSIATGVTLSVSSSSIDPADDDYDDTMSLRGTFSTLVPFALDGTVNMIQEGRGLTPQINGLTGFTVRPGGQVTTDGDAQINRGTTVQGDLHVGQGITQINAATILFESTANVTVADGGTLELNGPTTYEGGFHGGLGLIQFNGMTNINDDTTISAARIDLDGAAESTILNLNDSQLTLNVDIVDSKSVQYNGLTNVVGENAELAVNLSSPSLGWRLMSEGQLNFSNPAPNAPTVTMLSGSPLTADGVINAVGPLTLRADVAVRKLLNANTERTNVHFGGPTRSTIHANPMATVVGLGQITVDDGTTLNLEDQSQVAVDTTNRGRLEIGFEAAELSVDYTVPATATIRGFFAQTLTGKFAVDLRGTVQATRYDWLQVNGRARLSGTVEATFIDDFVPEVGTIFTILTATGGRDGEFDNVEAIDENDVLGYMLTDLYTATEAMLRVDDVFLIGDYNDDGMVNAADYVVWRKNVGSPSGTLPNDIHNTPIGALQYDTWKAHFGNTFPKPGALREAAVPEPATLALVWMAMFFLRCSKRECLTSHCRL